MWINEIRQGLDGTLFVRANLTTDMHEWLRVRAYLKHITMNSMILVALEEYKGLVKGGEGVVLTQDYKMTKGSTQKYNIRVNEELYLWLREVSHFTRIPINILVAEALTRYRNTQAILEQK